MPYPPWYAPTVRAVRPNEPWLIGVGVSSNHDLPRVSMPILQLTFSVTILGRTMDVHLFSTIARVILVALAYLVLWALLPEPMMDRGGLVFDSLCVIVVASVVGGGFCYIIRLPTLLGMLWVGIIWGNIPHNKYFTGGVNADIVKLTGRVALAIIIARAGFTVNLPLWRKMWPNILVISTVPLLTQAVVHAVITNTVRGYNDYTWAFLEGFIISTVGPGVIVPTLLALRAEGIGTTPLGPSTLMLAGVVFDAVMGIWVISFCIDLIFSSGSVVVTAILGPVQLIGGLIIGVLVAMVIHWLTICFIDEAAPIRGEFNKWTYSRAHVEHVGIKVTGLVFFLCASSVLVGYKYNLAGGGAICVLGISAALARFWKKPPPPPPPAPQPRVDDFDVSPGGADGGAEPIDMSAIPAASDDSKLPSRREMKEVQREMLSDQADYLMSSFAFLWDNFACPALFSLVGGSVVIQDLFNTTTFPNAIWIIAVGLVPRVFFAMTSGIKILSFKEILVVGVTWIAKATVQAALGGAALTRAEAENPRNPTRIANAKLVKNIALLGAVTCGPIAAILCMVTARRWLPAS